jgi:hypothetical protein
VLEEGRFGGRAPDLVHEASGLRIWAIEPLGILTQIGRVTVTGDAVAEFIATQGQALVDARFAEGDRIDYFHDWRRLSGYSPGARRIMTEWGMTVRKRTRRIVVALSPQAAMVRMGVSVATMMLKIAGLDIEVNEDLQPRLDALGVRPFES